MISPEQRGLGLELVENFATQSEADAILAILPKHKFSGNTRNGRNNIWRYGHQRHYRNNVTSKTIPAEFLGISRRLFELGYLDAPPMSITVNAYFQGQTITPHIDAPECGLVIAVVSLVAPATMRFTGPANGFDVVLPPLSVVFMRDKIRYKWNHEILPLEADRRYSVVFRA